MEKVTHRVERWEYDSYFKEYLLLLATKGSISLERTNMFPERIELGKPWHQTLNHMRKSTQLDKHEKWAFVGVKEEKRSIFFPTIPIKGNKDHVSSNTISKMKMWARRQKGIVDFLGDIHSHPSTFVENQVKNSPSPLSNSRQLAEVFSAGDLYSFIVEPDMYFMAVVTRDYNIFAFKTKENTGLGVNKDIFSQESFERYWYEKFGYRYLGPVEKFGALRCVPVSPNASRREMNCAIAERHGLLLYQGKVNEDLTKVFSK